MRHTLTKLSSPGYTFQTSHQILVYNQIENEICEMCMEECENAKKRKQIDEQELFDYSEKYHRITELAIQEMLATSCGAEFFYEEDLEELDEEEKN
jgi:hypothetical protein